jgi:hypothetical protein
MKKASPGRPFFLHRRLGAHNCQVPCGQRDVDFENLTESSLVFSYLLLYVFSQFSADLFAKSD